MPVILAETDWPKWLGEVTANETELIALLKPASNDMLRVWPVSRRVGNVKNNDASVCEPISVAAD